MGRVWSDRSGAYVFGVLCLVLATLAFAVGSVAPFWTLRSEDPARNVSSLHSGLWFRCSGEDWNCFAYDYSSDQDYLHVARGLQLCGLLALVVCVMTMCVTNCRRQHPGPRSDAAIAIFALISALLCLSCPMVYLIFTVEDVQHLPHLRYNWAFALSQGASGLALLASLVLLFITCCCCWCCQCASCSSPDIKTDDTAALNWGEDSQSESRMTTLRREDLTGMNGPYIVSSDDAHRFSRSYDDPMLYSRPSYDDRMLYSRPSYDDRMLYSRPSYDDRMLYSRPGDGFHSSQNILPPEELEQVYGGEWRQGPGSGHRFPVGGEVLFPRVYDSPQSLRDAGGGGDLPSGWSWHEGMDTVLGESSLWAGAQEQDGWLYYGGGTVRSSSQLSDYGDPALQLDLPGTTSAPHDPSPFLFPRVVLRGYYEPGYGYAQYVMRRGENLEEERLG